MAQETYLGVNPDSQEALEFLCLAEGAEVTHYEDLSAITKVSRINNFFLGWFAPLIENRTKHHRM